MPDSVIAEHVDIYQFPVVDTAHIAEVGDELTSGDLHGNVIKLLFLLVRHGVAKNMTKEVYDQLVEIYEFSFDEEGLSEDDLLLFIDLLDSIKFNSEATIRLLGDILADRGGNDYLTLLVLCRLHTCHVKYEIILSNHDLEFLINFQNPHSNFSTTEILSKGSCCRSMLELSYLIDGGLDRELIDKMVNDAYLPSLKLLSYTVNEQKTGITLFSHAPIGLTNIRHLARIFKVPCNIDSLPDLIHTIDAINRIFVNYLARGGKFYRLVNQEELGDPVEDPVGHALWNRDTESLERPAEYMGYKIKYTHGHHGDERQLFPRHIINLDNQLGKAYEDNNGLYHCNKGVYTLLHSGWKVGLHKSRLHGAETSTNVDDKRSPNELGQWLMVDFPGIVMSLDQEKEGIKHDFLSTVHNLGMQAANILHDEKNYKAASIIAKMCECLLSGFEKFLHDQDDLEFKKVCIISFENLQKQMKTPAFVIRAVLFSTLAKVIEDMHVGLLVKDLYSSLPRMTVSEKRASLFSKFSDVDPTAVSPPKPTDPKV